MKRLSLALVCSGLATLLIAQAPPKNPPARRRVSDERHHLFYADLVGRSPVLGRPARARGDGQPADDAHFLRRRPRCAQRARADRRGARRASHRSRSSQSGWRVCGTWDAGRWHHGVGPWSTWVVLSRPSCSRLIAPPPAGFGGGTAADDDRPRSCSRS